MIVGVMVAAARAKSTVSPATEFRAMVAWEKSEAKASVRV